MIVSTRARLREGENEQGRERETDLSRDVTRDAIVAMEEQDPQRLAALVQHLLDDKVVHGSDETQIQHLHLLGLAQPGGESVHEGVRVEFVARVEVEVLERVGRVGHDGREGRGVHGGQAVQVQESQAGRTPRSTGFEQRQVFFFVGVVVGGGGGGGVWLRSVLRVLRPVFDVGLIIAIDDGGGAGCGPSRARRIGRVSRRASTTTVLLSRILGLCTIHRHVTISIAILVHPFLLLARPLARKHRLNPLPPNAHTITQTQFPQPMTIPSHSFRQTLFRQERVAIEDEAFESGTEVAGREEGDEVRVDEDLTLGSSETGEVQSAQHWGRVRVGGGGDRAGEGVQEREGRRGEFAEFGELQVDDVRVVFDQRREGFVVEACAASTTGEQPSDRVQKKREIRKEGDKKRTGRHPQLERLQLWPLLNDPHAILVLVRTRTDPFKELFPLLGPDQIRRIQGQVPEFFEPRHGVGPRGEDVVVEAAALEEREVGEVRRKSRDRGEGAVGDFCVRAACQFPV
jgi:hypothetical protein